MITGARPYSPSNPDGVWQVGRSTGPHTGAFGAKDEPPDPTPLVVLVCGSPDWTDHRAVRRELIEAWRRLGRPVRFVTSAHDHGPVPTLVDEVVAAEIGGLSHGVLPGECTDPSLVLTFGAAPGVVGRMVERARDAGVPVRQVGDEDARRAAA